MTSKYVLPAAFRESAMYLLAKVSAEGKRRYCDQLAFENMRMPHHAALACADEFGPITQRELAECLHIDASDMVAMLDDLEELNWIERRRDSQDRRRNAVTITKSGQAALRKFQRMLKDSTNEFFAPLDDKEQAQLVNMLQRLYASFNQ